MEEHKVSFSAIIGHERPINILQRAISRDSVAHAYLFSGEEGIGKRMTAFALAAAVNCPDRGDAGGCGSCPSCRKVAVRSHPDVHVLAAEGDDIKIDQVREAQSTLALRPFEGAKKLLIVDGADAMNDAAMNAILKTLEEPPGDAVLILISARPQKLLPTIRSRCQEVRFLPLPRHALASALQQRRGLSAEDAWFVAALSGGSIGRGLAMDLDDERRARDELLGTLSALPSLGDEEVLALAETIFKDREGFERFLDMGVERLRDIAVFHATGDERLLVYPQPGVTAADRAGGLGKVLAGIDLLVRSRDLLSRRVSSQLVAENLFFTLRERC